MPFTITVISNEPFKSDSIINVLSTADNYVFDVRGFHELIRAAKNYKFVDVSHPKPLLDNNRITTVETIMHELDHTVMKTTSQITKDVIAKCIAAFRPIINRYAEQLKDVSIAFFHEQRVHFNLVLAEILNDSVLKLCIPYTRISKLFKYADWIREFINDILQYMIHSRPTELMSNDRYGKIITSIILVDRLPDDENDGVCKLWNETQYPRIR